MTNVFDLRMDLRELADEDLRKAIEDQEDLIERTPSVRPRFAHTVPSIGRGPTGELQTRRSMRS